MYGFISRPSTIVKTAFCNSILQAFMNIDIISINHFIIYPAAR